MLARARKNYKKSGIEPLNGGFVTGIFSNMIPNMIPKNKWISLAVAILLGIPYGIPTPLAFAEEEAVLPVSELSPTGVTIPAVPVAQAISGGARGARIARPDGQEYTEPGIRVVSCPPGTPDTVACAVAATEEGSPLSPPPTPVASVAGAWASDTPPEEISRLTQHEPVLPGESRFAVTAVNIPKGFLPVADEEETEVERLFGLRPIYKDPDENAVTTGNVTQMDTVYYGPEGKPVAIKREVDTAQGEHREIWLRPDGTPAIEDVSVSSDEPASPRATVSVAVTEIPPVEPQEAPREPAPPTRAIAEAEGGEELSSPETPLAVSMTPTETELVAEPVIVPPLIWPEEKLEEKIGKPEIQEPLADSPLGLPYKDLDFNAPESLLTEKVEVKASVTLPELEAPVEVETKNDQRGASAAFSVSRVETSQGGKPGEEEKTNEETQGGASVVVGAAPVAAPEEPEPVETKSSEKTGAAAAVEAVAVKVDVETEAKPIAPTPPSYYLNVIPLPGSPIVKSGKEGESLERYRPYSQRYRRASRR